MNLSVTFNIIIAIGWIIAATLDLILQRSVSWYVAMMMSIGLALWHIHAAIEAHKK